MLHPAPASSYFRNALCTISYHGAGYVQLAWTEAATNENELQALYAHALQALKHHRTGRLLTDHRRRQPLPLGAQQWIAQHWVPQAVREAGYSHCAIVENQTPLGRLAARAIGDEIAAPLKFRFFSEMPEAVAWLTKA
ncbi:STAS/SEC14 domain-containing protein [Hymenobacter sp. BT635]|uniref:STAS/SEC14 domain-containing protein n=1 Tax=Hymenobacter nitidus TaxID=2880929 RepID=A0ABS8A9D6_9BACT|nr:STAS/SEC14 domain-containing protein [Hymenobacter nitidus]MCB2375994.1 STAS/SEC14 domain-containing protein [Hymenobacter nitidus]